MARILCIGTVTLDIVNQVPCYPGDDEEMRILSQQQRRGGNAANTATVLAQLGHQTEFLGNIAADSAGNWISQQLTREQVGNQYCPRMDGTTPTSYITLSQQTGTRSILHFRDLPELHSQALTTLPLGNIDWVHFEARNIDHIETMMDYLQQQSGTTRISLEVEKPRPHVEQLFSKVSYLFFSRHYAESQGYTSPELFLQDLHSRWPRTMMSCTWGENGAYGITQEQGLTHHPALDDQTVIDTIGAGDTFNAGMIHQIVSGNHFTQALDFANALAGMKIAQPGFSGLGEKMQHHLDKTA